MTLLVLAACNGGNAAEPSPRPLDAPDPAGTATRSPSATPSPTPDRLAWGPSEEQYAEAAQLVAGMSVEERAGQVIIARFSGTAAPVELVERLHLGGVIVMGDNIVSADQVRSLTHDLEDANSRPFPLIIGVDQEGGRVARIGPPATEFPSLMTLGAADSADLATDVARASGTELRALGFTMVYAPDADVTTGPDDPTIGSRSASSDPQVVADIVAGALRGYAEAGIIAVPKHFPGHGSVPADSHEELPVQDASLAELINRDLVPFRAAVDAGAPAMMMAHIDVTALDAGVPSSLSAPVVDLLRDDVGFAGVVMTDAEEMAAVAALYTPAEAAVSALNAGEDVVLMPADVDAAHAGIVAAVSDGRLDAARLDEAATRVVALMLYQAEIGEPSPGMDVVGSHEDVSYDASLAGLTVVSGPCDGALVGDSIVIEGGSVADQERLAAAARDAGLGVGSGDVVRLLDESEDGSGDVVVSLDTPYELAQSTAGTAKIASYGRTPAAFRALVHVLLGEEKGGGRLPVDVAGVERAGCE
jgi:beta-N-acetylhexosaminidase